jgi:hypothetical protein
MNAADASRRADSARRKVTPSRTGLGGPLAGTIAGCYGHLMNLCCVLPQILRRAISRLALVLLFSAIAAFGQSTWGGLRFGMSVDDAKKLLAGRIKSEEQPPKNPSAYILTLNPISLGVSNGEPHVIFERGKLVRVLLMFSKRAEGCFDKPDRTRDIEKIITVDAVGEAATGAFQEKYGKPVNETGLWPSHDALMNHFVERKEDEEFKYTRAWRSQGQMIRISLSIICDSLFLDVSYDPESANPDI